MDESSIYTVPEQLLFRNFEVLSSQAGGGSIQTRSLLLQNKTRNALQSYVSYPFSKHFRVHAGEGQTLCSVPPHVALTVQPGVPAKLMVELRVPEDADLNYVQGASVMLELPL